MSAKGLTDLPPVFWQGPRVLSGVACLTLAAGEIVDLIRNWTQCH